MARAPILRLAIAFLVSSAAALVAPDFAPAQSPSCDFGHAHPQAPPETTQWDFLIGGWDVNVRRMGADGEWSAPLTTAYWEGRYILGGFAVADEWYDAPPGEAASPPGRGVNVRLFDPDLGMWEMTWQHTNLEGVRRLRARWDEEAGEMAMWQLEKDGTRFAGRRVTFHDIEKDAWVRTDERSQDGGRTWRETVRLEAARRDCVE